MHAHLGQLGSGTSSDLLGAELAKLSLELIKLLGEILLVLGPEGTGLDFSGRLFATKVSGWPLIARSAPGDRSSLAKERR